MHVKHDYASHSLTKPPVKWKSIYHVVLGKLLFQKVQTTLNENTLNGAPHTAILDILHQFIQISITHAP